MARPKDGTDPAPRATKIDVAERVNLAAELLSSALTWREVVEALCDQFKIKPRAAERYLTKVRAQWDKDAEAERGLERERQVRRLLRMIAKWEAKAPTIALRAERLLMSILGTGAPIRVVNVDEVNFGNLSDEQVRRIADGEDPAIVLGTPAVH